MESSESTKKKCNRCGRIFLNKSILKRHKKKCKVIKVTSEMADLSTEPNVICQMCLNKIDNFNEHVNKCSEFGKKVDVFNSYKPTIGYFGQADSFKMPGEFIVELLKKVPTAEKMNNLSHGLKFVDFMLANTCPLPVWKQFFTDVSFDVLMDGIVI
eukprot:TRINITY_DN2290_c0_g5_i2.p1 TRINITY_DN2290_c0_g5~~TRINITY_DN2290_c0_g5_i2.p1  ORF type:complete len:156 (+),score=15.45 TRINITY_DN2290_c0_g5_i2:102-569(+)